MLKRFLILGIGATILQTGTFIILTNTAVAALFHLNIGPPRHSINFGFAMAMATFVIFALTSIGNASSSLLNNKKAAYGIIALQLVLFASYTIYSERYGYGFARTTFILGLGLPTILIKIVYDKLLGKLIRGSKSSHSV